MSGTSSRCMDDGEGLGIVDVSSARHRMPSYGHIRRFD